MASSLADLCTKSLCRTDYEISSSPFPSIAERILLHSSSPRRLPLPVANALFEGLAQRGKLTKRILRLLLDRDRAIVTSLPLIGLRSIPHDGEETTFVRRLRQQAFLCRVDVSFSHCFGELSVSLVSAFADTCKDTLLSFSASHVTGDLGISRLKDFTQLRHVDLSYTSATPSDINAVCGSLSQLRHLNVSGTGVSWYKLFASAQGLDQLEYLGMSDLVFLTLDEWSLVSQPYFSTRWITDFFLVATRLSALDISGVICKGLPSEKSILSAAFHEIVTGARSLTHLETSFPGLPEVVAGLQLGNLFDQMKYLAYYGAVTSIPDILLNAGCPRFFCSAFSRRHYSRAIDVNNVDFVTLALKGGPSFRITALGIPWLFDRCASSLNAADRRDLLRRVMSAAVAVARFKLFRITGTFESNAETFLMNVIYLRTAHRTHCLLCLKPFFRLRRRCCIQSRQVRRYAFPGDFSDSSIKELWDQMIESCLEAALNQPAVFRRDNNDRMLSALCAALFVTLPRPPLRFAALTFFLNALIGKEAGTRVTRRLSTCKKCADDGTPMLVALKSIFESLFDKERCGLALEENWLVPVCNHVEAISLQVADEISLSRILLLNRESRLFLDILYYLSRDQPNVQRRLVQDSNLLTPLQLYSLPPVHHHRPEVERVDAASSLRVLIILAENESLRHRLLSKSSLQMLLKCHPSFETSYLTCLLLLCDDAYWPAKIYVLSKDAMAYRMITLRGDMLTSSLVEDTQRYRYSSNTVARLQDMAQRKDVPSPVGWFGMYVLSRMDQRVQINPACI